MNILIHFILVLWIIVALLMVLVILMQRPKSEGLGAAFGGGVTENIFGAQTTTVLTKITGWLAGAFFVLTFLLSVLYAHRGVGETALSRELKKGAAAPAASPAASAIASPTAPGAAVPAPGAPVIGPTASGAAAPAAAPTGSAKPSDLAVGAVPASTAPAASAAPAGSPSPQRP